MTASTREGRAWITWQDHRRSREIAARLNAKYIVLESGLPRLLRYLWLSLLTSWSLARGKYEIVFVQNPSIVLATIAVLVKKVQRFKLVVDRHSNFKLPTLQIRNPKWKAFHYLSRFSIRGADLTIVTNMYLADLVKKWGGRSFVLPDPIPEMGVVAKGQDEPGGVLPVVTYVCTFSDDEPIDAVFGAAAALASVCRIKVTGKPTEPYENLMRNSTFPNNVDLTGFLSEAEYSRLLAKSDAVMVLTTMDHCLNCGAYEAVALGRPMVLSDTETIRSHFCRGAVYARPDARSIEAAIRHALGNARKLAAESRALRSDLIDDWEMKRIELESEVGCSGPAK